MTSPQMTPTLSIIAPVYNVKTWLPACIDSIISQTFTDWELILIDDGSTDGSGNLCDDYASKDIRIKVIHKANAGVGAARNAGLEIATGKFLTFIDGDDQLGSDSTLEENIKVLMENTDIDIVQFPWFMVKNGKTKKKRIPSREMVIGTKAEIMTLFSYNKFTYQVWHKIYRADVFTGVRFPVDMKIGEDAWCLMDVLKRVKKVCMTQKGRYIYNIRETSAMRTMDDVKKYDDFKLSYRLFTELCSTEGVTESVKTYFFFIVIEKMCMVHATGKYNMTSIFQDIRSFVPKLDRLFHRMRKGHKRYLIQTEFFGIDYVVHSLTRQFQNQTIA